MASSDPVRLDPVGVCPTGAFVAAQPMARTYFRTMALFYLAFGLITVFSPGLMELFMTDAGQTAASAFSDQVWLHGGFDILSIALLLVVLSTLPATRTTLGAAAIVALFPTTAILYTLLATPYWSALFLVPAVAALALAVWGFMLARTAPIRGQTAA